MYKKITDNVSITVLEDSDVVYLHLKKHVPIVVNAHDKYHGGVEITICAGCNDLSTITFTDSDGKQYCNECAVNERIGE